MSTRYTTTHNQWDANLVFPFVVNKLKQDSVYIDPTWGLKMDQVTADGDPVQPVPHDVDMDDLNYRRTPIGNDPFIYRVRRLGLVFARSFDEKGNYELEKFIIPGSAKLVVFKYRLRESPDGLGPAMTLESRLV